MADTIKDRVSVLGSFPAPGALQKRASRFCPESNGVGGAQLFHGIGGAAREGWPLYLSFTNCGVIGVAIRFFAAAGMSRGGRHWP